MVFENRAFILNLACMTFGDPLAANSQPPLLIFSPTTLTHRETFIISSFPLSSLLHTSTIYLSRHRLDTFTRLHTHKPCFLAGTKKNQEQCTCIEYDNQIHNRRDGRQTNINLLFYQLYNMINVLNQILINISAEQEQATHFPLPSESPPQSMQCFDFSHSD